MPVDPGTIADWTQQRLAHYVRNILSQQQQGAISGFSSDQMFVHNQLTFSAGDFQTADTIITRPAPGTLAINGSRILTAGNAASILNPLYLRINAGGTQVITGASTNSVGFGAVDSGRGTLGVFIENDTAGRVLVTNPATTGVAMGVGQTSEAQWRWTVDSDGGMSWSSGALAADTNWKRVTGSAPSSGGIGIGTTSPMILQNTTWGIIRQAATNQSAFECYLLAADSVAAFKLWTQGTFDWGPGGASAADLRLARQVNTPGGTGTFLELLTGSGLGYGTGTGSSVTQLTSFGTTVTINKPTGFITLFTSATVAGSVSTFNVVNSTVGANDVIILNWGIGGGSNAGLNLAVTNVAAGSFNITFHSVSALPSATRTINFAVIKGAST